LKAIHNTNDNRFVERAVPFDRQRYKILKAIHNSNSFAFIASSVPFDRQRYKILKAIHNSLTVPTMYSKFLSTGKDTKF